jgi:hypothetical protein
MGIFIAVRFVGKIATGKGIASRQWRVLLLLAQDRLRCLTQLGICMELILLRGGVVAFKPPSPLVVRVVLLV